MSLKPKGVQGLKWREGAVHRTEIEFSHLIETFATLKSKKNYFLFLFVVRNRNKSSLDVVVQNKEYFGVAPCYSM
jgi:hypothetical protein